MPKQRQTTNNRRYSLPIKRETQRLDPHGGMDELIELVERVEIDHTQKDLVILDDSDNLLHSRLTITCYIDEITHYVYGLHIE